MHNFLTGNEISLIRCDWQTLLNSPEATNVTFRYQELTGASDKDDVFDVEDGSSQQQSFTGRVIQEIVKKHDETLLSFGILEVGDVIFYTDIAHDLSVGIEGSLEVVGPNNVEWSPVPRNLKEFYNYLLTRLGNSQLAQVIPCKLKQ